MGIWLRGWVGGDGDGDEGVVGGKVAEKGRCGPWGFGKRGVWTRGTCGMGHYGGKGLMRGFPGLLSFGIS